MAPRNLLMTKMLHFIFFTWNVQEKCPQRQLKMLFFLKDEESCNIATEIPQRKS